MACPNLRFDKVSRSVPLSTDRQVRRNEQEASCCLQQFWWVHSWSDRSVHLRALRFKTKRAPTRKGCVITVTEARSTGPKLGRKTAARHKRVVVHQTRDGDV